MRQSAEKPESPPLVEPRIRDTRSAAAEVSPLLQVTDLVRHFDVSSPLLNRLVEGRGKMVLKAVDGVSFSVRKGETFALVGESGCGKSTIARLLVGLYRPSSGSILFEGAEIGAGADEAARARVRSRMQMIFQDPYASLNPGWRVGNIIAEPIRVRRLMTGKNAIRERVGDLLRQVGLSSEDQARYPHEFSGGQRQRISIARALASEPDFLVCDEPTSALDVSVQAQILNLMGSLQRQLGLTYLFISHDLAVVSHVSTTLGVMYLGRLAEIADTRAIFNAPRHPYTRMLLDAVPDLEMTGRARIPVAGEIASAINPPTGCAFHPRCPWAIEACKQGIPPLREVGRNHASACIRDDIA
jgi:peptide/nickel transport system ATP-binding protein